jgi:hypothetical protein
MCSSFSTRPFALVLLLWVVVPAFARAQALLERRVDFACTGCSPAEALVELSRRAEVNIVFNDRFFQKCPPLDVSWQQRPLGAVLDELAACARGVGYRAIDGQIVFFRRGQRFTVSGYVQDADTGERLIGASIRLRGPKSVGTVSNEFGFFSLTLDEGAYELIVQYIGYTREEVRLQLTADRLATIRLRPGTELPEVVISTLPAVGGEPVGSGTSARHLPLGDLRKLPMPGGESDLLRLAALQAGVQTGADGLGGLHIRGGNADQNLILLDDVPVYNPSHALGLFSIFNPVTVSNARLWKGDFPARYGARASSVLDVRTRDGNFRDYHASVGAGLFAASASVEGPLVRDRSSFLLAMRSTYFDPWVRLLGERDSVFNFSDDDASYRFYDVNLKFNYILSERNRLYLSIYRGNDNFHNEFEQNATTSEGIVRDYYGLRSQWGNEIAALRWNHLLRRNLFTNTTLRFSRFYYQSRLRFLSTLRSFSGKERLLDDYAQLYQTLIRDWSGKTDFTFFPSDRLTLRWGLSFTLHNFQPGALSANFRLPGSTANSIDSLSNLLRNTQELGADESEGYFEVELEPWRNWRVEAGINVSLFQVRNRSYPAVQPRVRLVRHGRRYWSTWAGYHRATQNLHQIGSFNINLPFELWVPTTAKVQPEQVWQASAGVGWQRGSWNAQLEAYYKDFERVLTFLSANDALYAGGAEDASGWEDRVTAGRGYSRGLEFSVEKTLGTLTGSLAYTLSESIRQFDEVNSGRPFPFRFDRRHDFKIAARQRVAPWLDAEAIWSFATGNPITLARVKFQHQSPDGEISRSVFVYTDVNGYRLPNYHRLDLALNARYTTGRRLEHAVHLGVYNAYNRANPFFLFLAPGSNVAGKAVQYTLLPFMPSFRYEIRW